MQTAYHIWINLRTTPFCYDFNVKSALRMCQLESRLSERSINYMWHEALLTWYYSSFGQGREFFIQGEGALPLVQSSISFLISCFEKHNFYFHLFQQPSLNLMDNFTSGRALSPCLDISLCRRNLNQVGSDKNLENFNHSIFKSWTGTFLSFKWQIVIAEGWKTKWSSLEIAYSWSCNEKTNIKHVYIFDTLNMLLFFKVH